MSEADLIYSPARRRGTGVLIMFSGPPGSGKTLSALRLATGLANGGPIGFCDTEHGRALYYADDFEFLHGELKEPFTPARFERAAVTSQTQRHAVWICDSFSHEHVGPGGMLDMFEAELQRMAGNDWDKRERVKMTAWIKPKGEHKHLLQRLWQLNCHIILCCHADKKIEMQTDPRTKKSKPVDIGYQPICSPDIPYAMTASFMFDPARPGVPIWIKRFDKIEHCFDMNAPISEETGRRLAAWARGEGRSTPSAGAARATRPHESDAVDDVNLADPSRPGQTPEGKPDAESGKPPDDAGWRPVGPDEVFEAGRSFRMNQTTGVNEVYDPPVESSPESPPDDRFPGDIPLSESSQLPLGGDSKTRAKKKTTGEVLEELIARFEAVKVRADHLAIVDVKENRDRIAWIKKNKPEAAERLKTVMEASWARTQPQRENA